MTSRGRLVFGLVVSTLGFAGQSSAQSGAPLKLEKTSELPDVEGRIDHFTVDLKNRRLFMAALGNNTVEVIDLQTAKRVHNIRGLAEPQGVFILLRSCLEMTF